MTQAVALLEDVRVARKPKPPPAEEPKKGRARDRGEVEVLGTEVSTAHAAAIETCRVKLRWSKRTLVEAALEEFLTKHGAWPPPPE